jgi:spermidine/putrescine transport system substrate-binding protein
MTDRGSPVSLDRRQLLLGLGAGAIGLSLAGCAARSSLHFANWDNYLGETTLTDFKDASGIDTKLSVIASEDALFDQLNKGSDVPDLVIASNRMVERLTGAGLLATLSHARIPNLRNLDPRFADASYDPGRKHSVPYTWLIYGIGYRKSAVKVPPKGWKDLFANPANAGRIALPADPADLFRIAARTLGKGPNAITVTDVPALAELLKTQLPRIKAFHQDDGQDLLLNKEVDLVADFNGDLAQVILEDPDLAFVMPEEGSELTCDNLCIPKGASAAENAHQFIDFVLGGQAGSGICETILFPTPNLAAKAMMEAAYQQSPVLFPPAELLAKSDFARWNVELDQALNKAWEGLRQPLNKAG